MTQNYTIDGTKNTEILQAFATWADSVGARVCTVQPERYQAFLGTGTFLEDSMEWSGFHHGRVELKVSDDGGVLYFNISRPSLKREIDEIDIGDDLVGYSGGTEVIRINSDLEFYVSYVEDNREIPTYEKQNRFIPDDMTQPVIAIRGSYYDKFDRNIDGNTLTTDFGQ